MWSTCSWMPWSFPQVTTYQHEESITGAPSCSRAQDRSLCQPRSWQQYHPARDVAEPLSAAPSLTLSDRGLYPPSYARFGDGTLCALCLGVLVVTGRDLAAPGGLRGLGRQRERLQRAGPQQGPTQRSPRKERGEKQGKAGEKPSGVRKSRPGLSCCGRLRSPCSHGNGSSALPPGCFLRLFLKAAPVYAEQPLPGGAGSAGAQEGEHYLICSAGQPHKWQHQQSREAPGPAPGPSHSRRSPGAELLPFDFPSTLSRPSIL